MLTAVQRVDCIARPKHLFLAKHPSIDHRHRFIDVKLPAASAASLAGPFSICHCVIYVSEINQHAQSSQLLCHAHDSRLSKGRLNSEITRWGASLSSPTNL